MSYVLTIYRDGESLISEVEYTPSDKGDILAQVGFDELKQAGNVKIALMASNKSLRDDIETQAKVIQQLTERNDALHIYSKSLMRCYIQLARVAKSVMSQLSIQTILQKTHRERNEELRDIVRDIDYIVSKPVDEWLKEVQSNSDELGAIPF